MLKLYRFEFEDKGDIYLAEPKVPDSIAIGEDDETPRICVCNSIMGCIRSLEIPASITCMDPNWKETKLHLYVTEVYNLDFVHQPSIDQVSDVWNTGELWITVPTLFYKVRTYTISKQFEFPGICYSRFQMYPNPDYPVMDRIVASDVYGDPIDGFSFIALDERRMVQAIKYAEEHRYIP